MDLPHADVDSVLDQMHDAFDVGRENALQISAKTGQGCAELLPAIVARVPPPSARADAPLRLLLFDSWYDEYMGVLCLVEVLDGCLQAGQTLLSAASAKTYTVGSIALMRPLKPHATGALGPGQVGCVSLGMKAIDEASVGDTLSCPSAPQPALAGFKRPQPMVWAGLFPVSESGFEELQYAMSKFLLKDGSVRVEPAHSASLGRGLRCGFLGLLHMEVVQQRLQAEHDVDVLVSAPTVPLRATLTDGRRIDVLSADSLPPRHELTELLEPLVLVTVLVPSQHVGALISLCEEHDGTQVRGALSLQLLFDTRAHTHCSAAGVLSHITSRRRRARTHAH